MTKDLLKEWLKRHLPKIDVYQSSIPWDDFLDGLASFFFDIYTKTKNLPDLLDVDATDAEYLPYISATLGIDDAVASKITFKAGEDRDWTTFDDYSIFTRIQKGTVTDEEVRTFRNFLKQTIERNQTKGTSNLINTLFRYLNLDATVNPLWTAKWDAGNDPSSDVFGLTDDYLDTVNNFNWDVLTPENLTTHTTTSVDGTRVSSPNDTAIVSTKVEDKYHLLKDGEIDFVFRIPYGDAENKNVQVLFRGRKIYDNSDVQLDEYYIAGVGLFDSRLAIAKVSYDPEQKKPCFEILTKTGSADTIRTYMTYKLYVKFEGSTLTAKLYENQRAVVEPDEGSSLTIDAGASDDDVEKRSLEGTAYLTNNIYSEYTDIGTYGFRIRDTVVDIFGFFARPIENWPVVYLKEADIREQVKPEITDFYAAEEAFYDSVGGGFDSDTYQGENTEIWDSYTEGSSGLEYDNVNHLQRTADTYVPDIDSQIFSIFRGVEATQFEFETTVSFNSSDADDQKAGIVFGASDEFVGGEWVKNSYFTVELNKYGYDLVLEKVHPDGRTIVGVANLEDIESGESYTLKVKRITSGQVYYSEVYSSASADTSGYISTSGNLVTVSFGKVGEDLTEAILYDSNKKDAYFLAYNAGETYRASLYNRRGIITGVPTTRFDISNSHVDMSILEETDPIGTQLGLLTYNNLTTLSAIKVTPLDSEDSYNYDSPGVLVSGTDKLVELEALEAGTTGTSASLLTLSTFTSGASGTDYIAESTISKIRYSSNYKGPLIVQVEDRLYVKFSDGTPFVLAIREDVSDFEVFQDSVLVLDTSGFLKIYDGNVDREYLVYFYNNKGARDLYNNFLERQAARVKGIFVDDNREEVYIQLYYPYQRSGFSIGDAVTFGKITTAGSTVSFGTQVAGSDCRLIHQAYFDKTGENEVYLREWYRQPYSFKNSYMFRYFDADDVKKFVHIFKDTNSTVTFEILRDRDNRMTDVTRTYNLLRSVAVCSASNLLGVFQGRQNQNKFYIFYWGLENGVEDLYVFVFDSYTLHQEIVKISSDRTSVDVTPLQDIRVISSGSPALPTYFEFRPLSVIQVYDSFLLTAVDSDRLKKFFLLHERDIIPAKDYQESQEAEKKINVQPVNLPDYLPYAYKVILDETVGKNKWYFSGTPVITSGTEYTVNQALLLNGSPVYSKLENTDSINFFLMTNVRFPSALSGTEGKKLAGDTPDENSISLMKLQVSPVDSGTEISDLRYYPVSNTLKIKFTLGRIPFLATEDVTGTIDLEDNVLHNIVAYGYLTWVTFNYDDEILSDSETESIFFEDKYKNLTYEIGLIVDGVKIAGDSITIFSKLGSLVAPCEHANHPGPWTFETTPYRLSEYFWNDALGNLPLQVALNADNVSPYETYDVIYDTSLVASGESLTEDYATQLSSTFSGAGAAVTLGISVDTDLVSDGDLANLFDKVLPITLTLSPSGNVYNLPILVKINGSSPEVEKIKDGTDLRFTTARGAEEYEPFKILSFDKVAQEYVILVQPALVATGTNLYLYYGSEYEEELKDWESNPGSAWYNKYLTESYDALSAGILNVGEDDDFTNLPLKLCGVIFSPHKYPVIEDKIDTGYLTFSTKHFPVVLSIDEDGTRRWYDFTNLLFYGRESIYPSHLFEIALKGTENFDDLRSIRSYLYELVRLSKPAYTKWLSLVSEKTLKFQDFLSTISIDDTELSFEFVFGRQSTIELSDSFTYVLYKIYKFRKSEGLRLSDLLVLRNLGDLSGIDVVGLLSISDALTLTVI